MKSICTLSILLALLSPILLSFTCPVVAQGLSVSFEEQLVLGDDEEAPEEYLFGGPQFIRTDSEGRIYVATQTNSIRVFSPGGEYIKTLGRQGKGPGEFLAITGMTLGYRGELIVYDGQSRRLTRFYDLGDSLVTQSLPNPDWTSETIIPIASGQFASYEIRNPRYFEVMSKYVDDIDPVDYEDKAIHLLNGDSWEKTGSFFNVFDHYSFDPDDRLETELAYGNYLLARLNDTTLVVTNEVSNGSFYLLDVASGSVRKVEGHFSGRNSYERLDWDRRASYRGERAGVVSLGGGRNLIFQRKLSSRALLANDKWVLNFLTTAEGNTLSNYIEFLDRQGNYVGYTAIDDDFTTVLERYSDYVGTELMVLQLTPMHLDKRDRLYYVDWSSGIPVIRVTRIILG